MNWKKAIQYATVILFTGVVGLMWFYRDRIVDIMKNVFKSVRRKD